MKVVGSEMLIYKAAVEIRTQMIMILTKLKLTLVKMMTMMMMIRMMMIRMMMIMTIKEPRVVG